MRLTVRLLLFTSLLTTIAFGSEKSTPGNEDYVRPYVVPQADSMDARALQRQRRTMKLQADVVESEDQVCYTMRSLVVVRERDSDQTNFVGQRTCTDGSRFQVKHATANKR